MILFVNACVRAGHSRTLRLANVLLKRLNEPFTELVLSDITFQPVDYSYIQTRDLLLSEGDYMHPMFDLARQFAAADEIVMAAPYWDLLFPAAVRAYFEAVTVSGITFRYDEHGIPHGLCRAKHFTFVTTAGGPIIGNFGFAYAEALCRGFYGIETVRCISAEGLDIVGADVPAILAEAKKGIVSAGK